MMQIHVNNLKLHHCKKKKRPWSQVSMKFQLLIKLKCCEKIYFCSCFKTLRCCIYPTNKCIITVMSRIMSCSVAWSIKQFYNLMARGVVGGWNNLYYISLHVER